MMVDQAEHDVVRDAAYFNDLRRAVRWTPPTALLGTSGLAVYQRIESAQDFELQKQLESTRDSELFRKRRTTYTRYHYGIMALRIVTKALVWIFVPVIVASINSNAISNAEVSKNAPVLGFYGLLVAIFAEGVALLIIAKIVQFIFWRIGSEVIRSVNGISGNSRLAITTSGSDLEEHGED